MNAVTKPQFTMTPCESSQIHAHGHCPVTNTLALQFKRTVDGKRVGGSIYHYANFTQADYDAFLKAESLGSHFGAHIKSAKNDDGALKHPFTKQEEGKHGVGQ